jgi:hypothetical protein
VKYVIAVTLLFAFQGVNAGDRQDYGNWSTNIGGQTAEAYTANESNSSFGLFCAADQCLFYLHQARKCESGSRYSVLLNSARISTALTMQCTRVGGNLFQILDPFDAVLKATQSGDSIGFAVALQSGDFAVTRFSLNGVKKAIDATLLVAAKRKQITPPNSVPLKPKKHEMDTKI